MYLCAVLKLSELKLCNEFEVTLKIAVISCRITFSHWVGLDTLPYYSDSQYTCLCGVQEGSWGNSQYKTEVILNLKDAVMKTFGPDVVPKDCFVSSEDRYSIIMWRMQWKLGFSVIWSVMCLPAVVEIGTNLIDHCHKQASEYILSRVLAYWKELQSPDSCS